MDLSRFATIPGSTATGSTGRPRLTNLMQLTIDTSLWSRYRSITNPDFDPGAPLVQALPSLNVKQHTAIPRTDADTNGSSLSSDNDGSESNYARALLFPGSRFGSGGHHSSDLNQAQQRSGAIQGFVDDGLFIGQKDPAFLNMVFGLAEEADAASREL